LGSWVADLPEVLDSALFLAKQAGAIAAQADSEPPRAWAIGSLLRAKIAPRDASSPGKPSKGTARCGPRGGGDPDGRAGGDWVGAPEERRPFIGRSLRRGHPTLRSLGIRWAGGRLGWARLSGLAERTMPSTRRLELARGGVCVSGSGGTLPSSSRQVLTGDAHGAGDVGGTRFLEVVFLTGVRGRVSAEN